MLNKGFVLLDFLLVLVIIGMINTLTLNNSFLKDFKTHINTYQATSSINMSKLESIESISKTCVDNNYIKSNHDICFNTKGNVNQAQTLTIANSSQKIVIHLGTGLYEIK